MVNFAQPIASIQPPIATSRQLPYGRDTRSWFYPKRYMSEKFVELL